MGEDYRRNAGWNGRYGRRIVILVRSFIEIFEILLRFESEKVRR